MDTRPQACLTGSLPWQMHTLASMQQDTRPAAERDEALKQSTDLRRRHCHFQHELKRREQEYERLQASSLPVVTNAFGS